MNQKKYTDFCTLCRKYTEYDIKKTDEIELIKNRAYTFTFTTAFCKECGREMTLPGMIDLNSHERDEQYRTAEGLISIADIERLMDTYRIDSTPLSSALGFEKMAIARYLDGQMPSKEYSDIMKHALVSPEYMDALLEQNREKTGEAAFQKAKKAAADLKLLFDIPEKMLASIAYIFDQMQEVTPLMLQKLLYYIQGINLALFDRPLFVENCAAWQHGPVYPKVYALFKDFKYSPIDYNSFAFLKENRQALSEDEKNVIDLIIGTFGTYSGKILEDVTHNEKPWQDARSRCQADAHACTIIESAAIRQYFQTVSKHYRLDTAEGLMQYIHAQLAAAGY